MDTPSTESTSPLNQDGAAQAFSALLSSPEIVEKSADDLEKEALADLTAEKVEEVAKTVEEAPAEDDAVTIKVDGKDVTLSKAELADHYKNGLRQSDYTKKTMEVAEQRKAAEAEIHRATQERHQYAANLQRMAAQLEGALTEQSKIDMNALLESDPVEYLKQQHLLQQRQAAYQQNIQQQQQLAAINKAEQVKAVEAEIRTQQEELLAKLSDWKDPAKAAAEKTAIAKYLSDQGYDKEAIDNLRDHRTVILSRKAMLYDAMMAKANAASKKVAAAPQRVIKSGVGESSKPDGRSSAMQKLSKSGRVEDAAAVFASFL